MNHDHTPNPEHPIERAQERATPREPLSDEERLLAVAIDVRAGLASPGRGLHDAFRAYLNLQRPATGETEQLEDFHGSYVGYFPDQTSFVEAQLDERGWRQALDDFMTEQGMQPGDVVWDEGVVWDHLTEDFEFVERTGGVYVFRR